MNYLLDSSALLAYYFGETGCERVRDILADERAGVEVSVLTASEVWGRLRAEGAGADAQPVFDAEWQRLSEMMTAIVPVTYEVVRRSLDLRAAAAKRLPQIDALIAATAAVRGAVLVHRDPHFLSIPADLLQQEVLVEK